MPGIESRGLCLQIRRVYSSWEEFNFADNLSLSVMSTQMNEFSLKENNDSGNDQELMIDLPFACRHMIRLRLYVAF